MVKYMNKRKIVAFILITITIVLTYISYYFYIVESANSLINNRYCFYKLNCDTVSIDLAIEKYLKAEKLYGESFVYESCALAYYHNQKYDLSYEQFSKAIKYKNKFPLFEKLYSLLSFGTVEPSDKELLQIYWYYTLGNISTKLENYNQCVKDYTKMIEVATEKKRDALERDKRAFCYYKLKMYEEAKKDCIEEKKWLNKQIQKSDVTKLKDIYQNRLKKIDELLKNISKEQAK